MITRKAVEKIKKRAVRSLCTYTPNSAYVRIKAQELKAVCDQALEVSFAEPTHLSEEKKEGLEIDFKNYSSVLRV